MYLMTLRSAARRSTRTARYLKTGLAPAVRYARLPPELLAPHPRPRRTHTPRARCIDISEPLQIL